MHQISNLARIGLIIDKLTNSIENAITGDSFQTEISLIQKNDFRSLIKKNGWLFNWKLESSFLEREIYKLTIVGNQNIAQGLISLEPKEDHVYMHLIESAPFNRGKDKVYFGVLGNLVAFACKYSFQRGFEGNVGFLSKTRLVEHYADVLGAIHIGRGAMIIEEKAAQKLIQKYYPNFLL